MRKTRSAAAFALLVFLVSTTPGFAAADREPVRDTDHGISPIQRVVLIIKRLIAKPLDTIQIPRP